MCYTGKKIRRTHVNGKLLICWMRGVEVGFGDDNQTIPSKELVNNVGLKILVRSPKRKKFIINGSFVQEVDRRLDRIKSFEARGKAIYRHVATEGGRTLHIRAGGSMPP
jgi:hypothetical protein